jgi:hypothetical protein
MDEAVFADIQIPTARATVPLIRMAGGERFLKLVIAVE